jgi:hypothetical protein
VRPMKKKQPKSLLTLLDLRSTVERSDQRTSGIDDTLRTHNQEIEDLWKAFDDLVTNPIR